MRVRFSEQYKIDDTGSLSWLLGIQVKQSSGFVTVIQLRYISDCLERFVPDNCEPKGTPADISAELSKKHCPEAGSAEAVFMKIEV